MIQKTKKLTKEIISLKLKMKEEKFIEKAKDNIVLEKVLNWIEHNLFMGWEDFTSSDSIEYDYNLKEVEFRTEFINVEETYKFSWENIIDMAEKLINNKEIELKEYI